MYRPSLESLDVPRKSRRSYERRKNSCKNMEGQIRSKARELWEQKGRVQGKDLEIWLEAERIVKG
jgi:hypothetical protein